MKRDWIPHLLGLFLALNVGLLFGLTGRGKEEGESGPLAVRAGDLVPPCVESVNGAALAAVADYEPDYRSYRCLYTDGSYYQAYFIMVQGQP